MNCQQCGYSLLNLTVSRCPECGTPFEVTDYTFPHGAVEFACTECGQRYTGNDSRGLPTPREFRCVQCHSFVRVAQMQVIQVAGDPSQPVGRLKDDYRPTGESATGVGLKFFKDAFASFYIVFKGTGNVVNMLILLVLCAFLPVLGYVGCYGFIGQVIVLGWFCAFYFNTILEVARGEDDLPSIGGVEGWWGSIFRPLLLFVGVYAFCMIPFLVYTFSVGLGSFDPLVALALQLLGVFVGPMALLSVALGDSIGALRPDLMIKSIVNAFVPYLAVWLMLGVIFAGAVLLLIGVVAATVLGNLGNDTGVIGWLASSFGLQILALWLVYGYGAVVAMRIIGLFYRHFKHRFAWVME